MENVKNNIKFTSDGKKVKVLGALNSTEFIVQEIFIIDGQEVPSGENFTTKNLHDAPAKSWKQKNLEELEQRYETQRAKLEEGIKIYKDKFNAHKQELEQKTAYLRKFIDNSCLEAFDTLKAFLNDEIKYVVRLGYCPDIREFSIKYKTSSYEQKLKLLTLFGRDDGTLSYGVNTYSDGSGGYEECIPVKSKEEAIKILEEYINSKKHIGDHELKMSKKWGIKIKDELLSEYKKIRVEQIKKNIQSHKDSIKKYKEQLKTLDK